MTLKELMNAIRKRFLIILIIPVIASSVTAIYTNKFVTKMYNASTTFLVARPDSESVQSGTEVTQYDLNVWSQVLGDYVEVIKSNNTVQRTIDALGGKIYFSSANIDVSQPSSTSRYVQVTVSHQNPEDAAKIANELIKQFKIVIKDSMSIDDISIVDEAKPNYNVAYPNVSGSVRSAFIASLIGSIGLVLLLEFLDMTLKTNEDVEKHLGLPVLARIPKYY